jgi:hypothetical protein
MKPLLNDYMESLPLLHALEILIKEKLFGPLYDKTMFAIGEQFNTLRLEGLTPCSLITEYCLFL